MCLNELRNIYWTITYVLWEQLENYSLYKTFLKTLIRQTSKRKKESVRTRHSNILILEGFPNVENLHTNLVVSNIGQGSLTPLKYCVQSLVQIFSTPRFLVLSKIEAIAHSSKICTVPYFFSVDSGLHHPNVLYVNFWWLKKGFGVSIFCLIYKNKDINFISLFFTNQIQIWDTNIFFWIT